MFSVTDRLASAKTGLRLREDAPFLLYDISFYRGRNAGNSDGARERKKGCPALF